MTANDKVSILLVDDQPARLLTYEAILGDLGQHLVQATSGVEALDRLMREDFAVILLDVSMPDMDGFETATLIHQHPRFEKTPIIFVTALHVTDMDRLKGYALGAVDYVYVPVVPEILRSKVSVLVELHQKRRELQRLNRSLAAANEELAAANSALQAEKTRELQQLNRTLAVANADLARANETLQTEMTAREQLEGMLRDKDRRKDEFLAMLAHELRNPLAPILNAVELLRAQPHDDPQHVWCRELIGRQTQHLTRLVDDLLDVSRITQGKIKLQRERVDLGSIVTRAVEGARPALDARRHVLTVELPARPVTVHGDPMRLAQVVGNLLSNAAKYTEDGGRVEVTVEAPDDDAGQALLRVKDSGVGIPPAMLPKLFELFTQVDGTLHRSQGGLGIGLALVRRLVEMHGGSVAAHSEGDGRGSEFVVRLPVVGGEPAPADAAPAAAPAAIAALKNGAEAGRRVLVADDNADAAHSLALLLQIAGNVVEVAHDGLEAVAIAGRMRPDLVLLDLGMPNLDGFGAAQRIRAEPWGRDLMLVAVTGWGHNRVRARIEQAGFDAHLVKPVDLAALRRILADSVSRPK